MSSSSRPLTTKFCNAEHVVEINCHKSLARDVANFFRTACYSILDFHPDAAVRNLANELNFLEDSPAAASRWKVRQTAEELVLHGDTSGIDLKASVERNSDIFNGRSKSPTINGGILNNRGTRTERNFLGLTVGVYRYMVNEPAVLLIERKGSPDFLIGLPYKFYNTNEIKIEENNQVLKVTVTKLKPRYIRQVDWECRWNM